MPKKLDFEKPFETFKGDPARFLGRLNRISCPLVFAVDKGGNEMLLAVEESGSHPYTKQCSVRNVPEPNRFWGISPLSLYGPFGSEEDLMEYFCNGSIKLKGIIEETSDGEFVKYHPKL